MKKLLFNNILKKNNKFKNSYKDKECFIFGNGSSIKKFDLKLFANKLSMTCGWLYLHKDFKNLNIIADFEIHPAIFFPIWKNEYTKKTEYNIPNYISKKKDRFNKSNIIFASLTNFPALFLKKNVFYLYHFGEKKNNLNFINPCETYSLMENSLYTMVGMAHFMGFKKVFLVGMDYLLDEPVTGHFYEDFELKRKVDNKVYEKNKYFFDYFSKYLEFTLIKTKETSSSLLNSINYSDLFNTVENNHKNDEIVSLEDLRLLDSTNLNYKIF